MPKKIRELKAILRQAGWLQLEGGKGSHTKWMHPRVKRRIVDMMAMMLCRISSEM